jgi:hypothetical protein
MTPCSMVHIYEHFGAALKVEAVSCSETNQNTRRHIPEDGIFQPYMNPIITRPLLTLDKSVMWKKGKMFASEQRN